MSSASSRPSLANRGQTARFSTRWQRERQCSTESGAALTVKSACRTCMPVFCVVGVGGENLLSLGWMRTRYWSGFILQGWRVELMMFLEERKYGECTIDILDGRLDKVWVSASCLPTLLLRKSDAQARVAAWGVVVVP